jgi:hypothetical protein
MGIVGQRQLLVTGREVTWSELGTGDEVQLKRLVDTSVWIHDGEALTEFEFVRADLESTGKMIQAHWPGRSVFRKFERALVNSLWILIIIIIIIHK